jgi:hypothetical protein
MPIFFDQFGQGDQGDQGNLTFAQLGTLFNAITDEVTGGVSQFNQQILLNQVKAVQTGMQALVNGGAFTDGATITHAQNIADQMNFLTDQIGTFGTVQPNPNPKFINDVIRDVQDIVQNDPNLAAMVAANHGFQQVSNLLTPPTPFPDTPLQTQTLLQFIADSNSLAARSMMVANGATDANLIPDIQAFSAAADAYSTAQGGVFSARFNNEFTLNGVQGTASRELVTGLMNGDANLINGAASVLMANAADVRGNMLVTNQVPVPPTPPPAADSVHNAGLFFDDAATKLIGGVYSGNQASIVSDLHNAATGVQADIAAQPLTGQALTDAQHVVALLGMEAGAVAGINTANPTPVAVVNSVIGFEQAAILHIVNNDPTLKNLANGSFLPNPPILNQNQNDQGQNNNAQGPNDQGLPANASMTAQVATDAAHAMSMNMSHIDYSHMWHHA